MTGFDTPRLIYLLVLLGFLIFGVLISRQKKLRKTTQHALIWVLIFLGFVACYGLRDVIIGQLYIGYTREIGDNMYELRRANRGHFHAIVEINGVPIKMIVDTGATMVTLTQSDAIRIGLNPDELDFSNHAQTANGLVLSAPITLTDVTLGNTQFDHVQAAVNGGDLFQSLLGLSLLNQFAKVEITGSRLVLTPYASK